MYPKNILNIFSNVLKEKYQIYNSSLHLYDEKAFFLCKNSSNKFIGEINYDKNFILKNPIENISELDLEGEKLYFGLFNTSLENSKKLVLLFEYLIPKKVDKKISFGFGDRIGIGTNAHAVISKKYNIFPVFAQQSIREMTKTSKTCEEVLHNAVIGIFQNGFNGKWGADADHLRDEYWLNIILNNKYLPYTMFTIDTYDCINTLENNIDKDVGNCLDFKERFIKAKKYIGKHFNFFGYKFSFDEDSIYSIVKKYYKSLDFLLKCFNSIKEKITNFDFEPTFDETNIDTTPEEHFYLVSEMLREGIKFSTLAIKFPGIFEKGIDYIGDINEFIYNLKIHSGIVNYFENYKLSIHSADDKFKIFKSFREILGDNFHIKTSGTTWMESLRTVAICNPDLFKAILNITFEKAEENSRAYYIELEYKKINDLLRTKNIVDLIDIGQTRQLLHVSYGSILEKYRNEIITTLLSNEKEYTNNIVDNYKRHFDAILL